MKHFLITTLLLCASLAVAQDSKNGNITTAGSDCTVATNCVSMPLAASTGAVGLSISGTFTATVQFEVSADNGSTWVAASGTPPGSTTTATSATAAGTWRFAVSGLTNFRVRASAYSSGTIIVTIQSSQTSAGLGGSGGGFTPPVGTVTSGTQITFPANVQGQIVDKGGQVYNVRAYSASASTQTTTNGGTLGSGATSATLASAIDFANGQGIYIVGAGASGGVYYGTITAGGGTTSLTITPATSTNIGSSANEIGHDDAVAINAAEDVCEASTFGGTLYFPPGGYNVASIPVHKHSNNCNWQGASRNSSYFRTSQGVEGPIFGMVGTSLASYTSGGYSFPAALLTGSGQSYDLAATTTYFLDLRDGTNSGELNALTAFTAEATIKLTALPAASGGILTSGGQRDSQDGYRSAFSVFVNSDGSLECKIKVSTTGTVDIKGSAAQVTTGANHHVAISWDGTNSRCFYDGTQITNSPKAATGTMVQVATEQVTVGRDVAQFPEGGTQNYPAITGKIDGIRLSNNARYTANFTAPTAKWGTADNHTLVQLNFDNQTDLWTVGQSGVTGDGNPVEPVYLIVHRTNACPGGTDTSLVEDLGFHSDGGAYLNAGSSNTWERISFFTGHNPFVVSNCTFDQHYTDMDFPSSGGSTTARAHWATTNGIMHVDRVNDGGNASYPIIHTSPFGSFENYLLQMTDKTKIPALFVGAGSSGPIPTIRNFDTDCEAPNTSIVVPIMLDQLDAAHLDGIFIDATCFGLDVPAMRINSATPPTLIGGSRISIDNSSFSVTATQTSVIDVTSPLPTQPIALRNSLVFSGVGNPAWGSCATPCIIGQGLTLNATDGSLLLNLTKTSGGDFIMQSYYGIQLDSPNRNIGFSVNGSLKWFMDATGFAFTPNSDNSLDLGETASRLHTGYFGTSVISPAVQGGVDATTQGSGGSHTTRGEDVTGGSTATLTGGAVTIRGGDNASTGNTSIGGAATVRGGDATGGTGTSDAGGALSIRGGNCTSTTGGCAPGAVSVTSGGFTAAFTNGAAPDVTISAGVGTGNAAVSHFKIQSPALSQTSGSTAQTQVTRYVTHVKAGSTTTATPTSMFNVALANNQTAGFMITVHVETTQATPHNCSTTETFVASVQDTGGTVTQQTTAGSIGTICDTGTLTLAAAFSAAAPSVFTVTPSWATIAPSAVTITIQVQNLSQQEIALL